MGVCASSDNTTKSRGRNTNRRGDRGKKGGKKRPTKKYESESSEEESSNDSHSDSEQEDSKSKPTTQQPLKIATAAKDNVNYPPVSQEDMDILFYKAFICTHWAPTPIPHELLRNAMKLALLAPSAYNCCPMRVVFVTNENAAAKAKLLSTLDPENVQQTQTAPVTAIVCTDLHYTRNLPKLMPYVPNAQQMFEQYDDLNEMIRIRNSNLQAGYLILALRSLGLAVGPVSGFDNQACDEQFLEGSSWRSNFLINCGYPHPEVQHPPRLYRLGFDASMKML